jgi:hypothetical protein
MPCACVYSRSPPPPSGSHVEDLNCDLLLREFCTAFAYLNSWLLPPRDGELFDRPAEIYGSDPGYRGEACQHLDLDLVDLEVKGHFRIRKVQPEV